MSKVSDTIEDFILSTLGNSPNVNLSRNDLAQFFGCAPSQINYVLTTRFNLNRGFVVESQRGGGGYIRLVKINLTSDYLKQILDTTLSNPISYKDACFLLDSLCQKKILTPQEARTLSFAITDKALSSPIKMEDKMRANILKNAIISITNNKENRK